MSIETEQKSKNLGNITSIMGYCPRNGQIGHTEPALNMCVQTGLLTHGIIIHLSTGLD